MVGRATVRGLLTSKDELGENALHGVRFVFDRVVVVGNHEEVDRADNLTRQPQSNRTKREGAKTDRSGFGSSQMI